MKDCHTCRYHHETSNPYHRCLLVYGEGIAKEKVKNGLIGECGDYKPTDDELRRMAESDKTTMEGEK